ncbi:MAG: Flp pilus assembly protein CpaB [Planctomycetota bacterium]
MKTIALVIAIVLGIAAAFGIRTYIKSREQEFQQEHRLVEVLETRSSIESGERLSGDMVGYKKVPADTLTGTEITKTDIDRYVDREIKRDVGRGVVLRSSHFLSREPEVASTRLSEGTRAVTVPVDNRSGVAGLVRPGDHVNILATGARRGDEPSTWTVLSDVPVLAVDDRMGEGTQDPYRQHSRGYSTLTFVVNPTEAQVLSYLRDNAELACTLRPRGEVGETADVPDVNASNVRDLAQEANRKRLEELQEIEDPDAQTSD